jgi:serine/threonine protein kinase
MNCLDPERLLAYLRGGATSEEIDHIDDCPACQNAAANLPSEFDEGLQRDLRQAALEPPFSDEEVRQAVNPVAGVVPDPGHGSAPDDVPPTRISDPQPVRLGGYELIHRLGEPSGIGIVWLARHPARGTCAVKELRPERTGREELARFRREFEVLRRLEHPNIVRVLDGGEDDGRLFLVMEYLDGFSFSQLVTRNGPLAVADACELVRRAALGLHHVHAQGLVHRDVKSGNLMLDGTVTVKVVDFGLATAPEAVPAGGELTYPGQAMGTPDYMAPEQIEDAGAVDRRADLYGLGCTLCHLLTGRPPYPRPEYPDHVTKMAAHLHRPVPSLRSRRAEVPPQLAELVEKRLLAKNRADRFNTAAELAAALKPFTTGCNLAALLGAGQGVPAVPSPSPAEPTMPTPPGPVPSVPLHANLDVLFWNEQRRSKLSITEPGALPVSAGALFQIEVRLNRPADVYLVWIDSEGNISAVYPWEPGSRWDLRRSLDRTTHLLLPEATPDGGYGAWPIRGPAGVETLVLMAREEPLSGSERAKLPGRLPARIRPLEALPDPGTAYWCTCRKEEGPAAAAGGTRGFGLDVQIPRDPLFQIDSLLRDKLGSHFHLVRAVSFTNLGPQGANP